MKTLKQLESNVKRAQTRYDKLVTTARAANPLYDHVWPVRYTRAHYFSLQALGRAVGELTRAKRDKAVLEMRGDHETV